MRKYRIIYGIAFIAAAGFFVWKNEKESLNLLLFLMVLPIVLKVLCIWDAKHFTVVISGTQNGVLGEKMQISLTGEGNYISLTGRIHTEVLFCNLKTGELNTEGIDLFYKRGKFRAEFLYIGKECGKVRLESTCMYCVDCLGLTKSKVKGTLQREFLVYPKLLEQNAWMEKTLAGRTMGYLQSIQKQGNVRDEIFDIRAYMEGDSMSRLHWKLSAKWEKLIVAEYGDDGKENMVLLLDITARTKRDIRNELMSLMGSVGNQLQQIGTVYCVAMAYDGKIITHKVTSEYTFMQMLTVMVCTPLQDKSPVELFRQSGLTEHFSKIVCFTDSPDEQMPDTITFEPEKFT